MENKQKWIKIKFSLLIGFLLIIIVGGNQFFPGVIERLSERQAVKAEKEAIGPEKQEQTQELLIIEEKLQEFKEIHRDDLYFVKSRGNLLVDWEAKSIPVLLYHKVVEKAEADTQVDIQNFISQMRALKSAGYQTINLAEYYQYISGQIDLPAKSFLLTFDDGARDSFYNVDPVLETFGFQAVNFLITKYVGQSEHDYYLNKYELAYMLDSGRWEFAPHGYQAHEEIIIDQNGKIGNFLTNKKWLNDLDRAETSAEYEQRIKDDIDQSNKIIFDLTGKFSLCYAFPFSDYGQHDTNYIQSSNVLAKIFKENYKMVFYQADSSDEKKNNIKNGGFWNKRIIVSNTWDGKDLLNIIESDQEKILPYETTFSNSASWSSDWGNIDIGYGYLQLSAISNTQGASAILEGGENWKNYELLVKTGKMFGESISLISHFQDNGNYLSCNFTTSGISVKEVLAGKEAVLAGWDKEFSGEEFAGVDLGIRVTGDKIQCLLNDVPVVRFSSSEQRIYPGTVGIKIWDSELNYSKAVIKSLIVTSMY